MLLKLKYFYIFLVLNIFLCYSGICSTTTSLILSKDFRSSGCHEMVNAHNDHSNITVKYAVESQSNSKRCCLDTISNSKENQLKPGFTYTLTTSSILAEQETKSDYTIIQSLNKGHPPPKVFLQNSSLLI